MPGSVPRSSTAGWRLGFASALFFLVKPVIAVFSLNRGLLFATTAARKLLMSADWNLSLEPKKNKSQHVWTVILVLVGLGLLALFFSQNSRFDLQALGSDSRRSARRLVWTGPLTPKELRWRGGEERLLDGLLARELAHTRQLRIHVEAQDKYTELNRDTPLRYWYEMDVQNGERIRSVVLRSTPDDLSSQLVRRLRADARDFRHTRRQMGTEKVDSFTNSM